MGTIVEARVPAGQFALVETFDTVADASLQAAHVVATRDDHRLPFFWATGSDLTALDRTLVEDPTTTAVTRLVRNDDRVLYRIRWCPRVRTFVFMVVAEQGTIVDAEGRPEGWRFRILFPNKDAMSNFYDCCQDLDVDIDISRVNGLSGVVKHGGTRLSAAQYEALSEALDSGYYQVPRDTTLVELSDRLDVSHQAVSERLRRGLQSLIESKLHDGMAPSESLS